MTEKEKEKMIDFTIYATFGCIENPSCLICAARNLVKDLGLDPDNMEVDLKDHIERARTAARFLDSGNDKIRWIFVKTWIEKQL